MDGWAGVTSITTKEWARVMPRGRVGKQAGAVEPRMAHLALVYRLVCGIDCCLLAVPGVGMIHMVVRCEVAGSGTMTHGGGLILRLPN